MPIISLDELEERKNIISLEELEEKKTSSLRKQPKRFSKGGSIDTKPQGGDLLTSSFRKFVSPPKTMSNLIKEMSFGKFSPMGLPLATMDIGEGIRRRIVGGVANVMSPEKDKPLKQTLKDVAVTAVSPALGRFGKPMLESLAGDKVGKFGDPAREVGLPGPVSKGIDMAGDMLVTQLLTGIPEKIVSSAVKARPKIMNDKWFTDQAKLGRVVYKNFDDAIGGAFDSFYQKTRTSAGQIVDDIPFNPDVADDIILKMGFDDAVNPTMAKNSFLQQVDDFFQGRIDTIGKLRQLKQLVRSKVPKSYYFQGGVRGKGGMTSPKIQKMNVSRRLQEEINNAVKKVDPEVGKQIEELNKFASDKLYPRLERLEGIFGKRGEPRTQGVTSTFALKNIGTAGERQAIRTTPKLIGELKKYLSKEYADDLVELGRNAKQLLANMNKYRGRQTMKIGAGGAGAYLLGRYLYGGFKGVGGD